MGRTGCSHSDAIHILVINGSGADRGADRYNVDLRVSSQINRPVY
jgi:hypothetical protein